MCSSTPRFSYRVSKTAVPTMRTPWCSVRVGAGGCLGGYLGRVYGWVCGRAIPGTTQPPTDHAAARSRADQRPQGAGPPLQGESGSEAAAGITGSGDGGGDGHIPTLRARSGLQRPSLGYDLRMPPPGLYGEIPLHFSET